MDLSQIGPPLAQLAGTLGALVWIARRNTAQIDKVIRDINVIKTDTALVKKDIHHHLDIKDDVRRDHDELIRIREVLKHHEKDIANQHQVIREHRGAMEKMIKEAKV